MFNFFFFLSFPEPIIFSSRRCKNRANDNRFGSIRNERWQVGVVIGRTDLMRSVRIYDVQVIESGPLTDDAGREVGIFHRDISLPLFPPKSPWAPFTVMTALAKSDGKDRVSEDIVPLNYHKISLNSLWKFVFRILDWLCAFFGRKIRKEEREGETCDLRGTLPWSDSLILTAGPSRGSPSHVGQTLTLSENKHSPEQRPPFLFYKEIKRRRREQSEWGAKMVGILIARKGFSRVKE